ncbi:hypothetical protein [Dyadobacter sp. MSC1_007]|jgi:hypothetical protein|uniref:hypothetical protein n=1 Tax=Dyadobacter sp. MSC1_007 TaxID=2909264 RepID=UPI00202DBCBB|nr:hypothetical protein [Dyadobacter sp. MSC1_007]
MKLHKTTSIVIQGMLMLGLLGACQNEDALIPQSGSVPTEDQNAKTTAELKLVKDGNTTLQYITAGRFTGKLSKVSETAYYTNYSYDDGTGDLWITSKRYAKSTNSLVKEIKYHISNNRCIKSIDVTNGRTSEFKYNETGRLDEINESGGGPSQKHVFKYDYISAMSAERLSDITSSSPTGDFKRVNFFYTVGSQPSKQDKYYLNPELTGLDKYLSIFGKFSDAVVQRAQVTPLPYSNQSKPFYQYYYGFDYNGYASSITKEYYPLGYGYSAGKQTNYSLLSYSTQWMGL